MNNQRTIKHSGEKKFNSAFNAQSRGNQSTPASALSGANPNYKTFNANGFNNKNLLNPKPAAQTFKSLRRTAADDEDDGGICLPTKDSLSQGALVNQNSQVQPNSWDSWDTNTEPVTAPAPKKPEEILGGCMAFVVNNGRMKDIEKDPEVYEPDEDEEDDLDLRDLTAIAAREAALAEKKKKAALKLEPKQQPQIFHEEAKPKAVNRFLQESRAQNLNRQPIIQNNNNNHYNREYPEKHWNKPNRDSGQSGNNNNQNNNNNHNHNHNNLPPREERNTFYRIDNKEGFNRDERYQKGQLNRDGLPQTNQQEKANRSDKGRNGNQRTAPITASQENHDGEVIFAVNKNRVISDDSPPRNTTKQNNFNPNKKSDYSNKASKKQGIAYIPKAQKNE